MLLINRLKDMTLNFSLDRVKFQRLLQLSTTYEDLIAHWFEAFSHDRASHVVDGLEFLAASIMVSSKVSLFRKICLLFKLFDLDRTGVIRKDEFTIFLKAVTTGLHRMVDGVPPPAAVVELGAHSSEFFATLSGQTLSQQELLMWMTEAHFALHYLSVLSKLGTVVFAWGTNHRYQLGLNMEPREQRLPSPLLPLEGIQISNIASNESHCLFLTSEGRVWSCGSGFCGLLGHGGVGDCPQPRLVEALAHTPIVDVAVGVRHSVAISEKGQVFTWGADDLYQLGHGNHEDKEVYEQGVDAKTGGTFVYVTRPTVVMDLFGSKVVARKAICCSFSTLVLTDQGRVYSWGNNTDGQCGQGQICPDHTLVYVDPHMQRTAMQCIVRPKRIETNTVFKALASGGYHTLAIDRGSRLWSFGQGMWGKLGHGDQRSMYEPYLVESMRHHVIKEVAAGGEHSLCLTALYRLTITGSNPSSGLSAFSLLGLPIGRVDRHISQRKPAQPPHSTLHFHAFASAPLLEIGLPFRPEPGAPVVNPTKYPVKDIQESVILVDRALWEGEWMKLATTDFDFNLVMSHQGALISGRASVGGQLQLCLEGKYDAEADFAQRICIFDLEAFPELTSKETLQPKIWELAKRAMACSARACLCILPKEVNVFAPEPPLGVQGEELRSFSFGVLPHHHGEKLKAHVNTLVGARIAERADGIPEEVRPWRERREEFTGRPFYENSQTGKRRWAPPIVNPNTEASLIFVGKDQFLNRLQALVELKPKAIIVSHQSWRPDVEMIELQTPQFDLEHLDVPIVQVTYEAGEELKNVCASGAAPFATFEVQEYGGVFSWGNGTLGQLGLAGIENRSFLTSTQNTLTLEENSFVSRPCYVAHLHEHQVISVACGASHTTAVTQQGEVFAWGDADGLGVPVDKTCSDVPMFVDQLEGLVRASRTFAGAHHSFVTADMPFPSVL